MANSNFKIDLDFRKSKMLTSLEPKSLDPKTVASQKQRSVVWKETTVPKASLYADHSLKTKHTVGKIVHNVHKIYRVLQKSNYLARAQRISQPPNKDGELGNALQAKLEGGDP